MIRRSELGPLWVVGWREWLTLPDLGIPAIKVKVDTGATSSALHAFDLEHFRRRGKRVVRFRVYPYQRDDQRVIVTEAEVVDERRVRDSGGHVEQRPVISTTAKLRGRIWAIEITLSNRDQMGFRMLLGRQALRGRFLINPGGSFLGGPRPRKKPRPAIDGGAS